MRRKTTGNSFNIVTKS